MTQVVYIDDEPALCRVFAMVIEARGVVVVTFTDPVEALAYLSSNDVTVVFCDQRMPKMSGLEVLDALVRAGRAPPFYLLSGDLDAADAAGTPGVTGMLAKPFRAEDLLALVERYTQ